ncbi:hypothetical protein AB0F91_32360 [Amycolatopsis sp. NPDC023774]|uniref:hypothetical protein n=1 Tax=Amycolatopsis sp. NPDC023774 TaxID=3155015 RepID=UPI0033F4D3EB
MRGTLRPRARRHRLVCGAGHTRIGADPRPLLGHFTDLRRIGKVGTGTALPSVADDTPLWLATGRRQP